jgi:hypothetical protein
MAMPFLESLVRQGLGANEVLRRYSAARVNVLERVRRQQPELLQVYQKHFGKIRRQKGLGLVRFLKEQEFKRPYTLSLTSRGMPDPRRIPYGKLGMGRKYSYTFRARGRMLDGSTVERWVTITANELRPWGDYAADAAAYFEGADKSGGLVEYTYTHQEIIQRPEEPGPL